MVGLQDLRRIEMPNSLKELLEEEIRDLYDAEKQLVKALPKMAKAAQSEELRSGFEEHLEATKGQVTRLEEVFRALDAKAKGKPCAGMKGIVAEGQEAIQEHKGSELIDMVLIGAAKRVEHYEMAAYQSVIKLAEAMGDSSISELLRETLSEEEETDRKLDEMCDELIQEVASPESTEEDEDEGEEMPQRQRRPAATAKTRKAG